MSLEKIKCIGNIMKKDKVMTIFMKLHTYCRIVFLGNIDEMKSVGGNYADKIITVHK